MEHRIKNKCSESLHQFLFCYFSVIFNALSSSLVCLTSLIILLKDKSSDMAAGPPLYLYCYFSIIFNALISSLVCLTSLYYCKKSSDMAAGPLTAGEPCMAQMVQWLIRPWMIFKSTLDSALFLSWKEIAYD